MAIVLTKEAFLAKPDLGREFVPLPEYGEEAGFFVRVMTGRERGDIERQFSERNPTADPAGFRAALLVRTIVDDAGALVFADADIGALLDKAAGPIERLFEASARLNGFTRKDVEDLEKN